MAHKNTQSRGSKAPYVIAIAVMLVALGAVVLLQQRMLPISIGKSGETSKILLRSPDSDRKIDANQFISGEPSRIMVPTTGVDLPVVQGLYDAASGSWTLSGDKAHYAAITPLANNSSGNTFIYGHNNRKVFAALEKLRPGDKAVIETKEGYVFEYVLREVKEVTPQDTSLFQYQGKSILTVQTCSGTWFENRKLFTFDFVKVEAMS